MTTGLMHLLGLALATIIIGFLGSIITCGLPQWRVTAFIGANIVTSQVIWEGLWMSCVTQSTGQMQCKVYDSMLELAQDLQAARALTVIAIIAGVFGILLAVVGGKFCWTANTVIRDFYNPTLIAAQKRELGASLYIGWGTAGVLILGGGLLCSSCPPNNAPDYDVRYSKARSVDSHKEYV
uniref:Claudin n=1 Tax=Pundamilia nyererei TaxID=303518 RepID=A0A3B4GPP7_9CICH